MYWLIQKRSLEMSVHIISRIYIALESSACMLMDSPKDTFFLQYTTNQIEVIGFERCTTAPMLQSLYLFQEMVTRGKKQHGDVKMVCSAGTNLTGQVIACVVVACHAVMAHGLGFEEAFLLLNPFHNLLQEFSAVHKISVESLLRSFCCA